VSAATAELGRRDPVFAAIVARFGPPPAWEREPGFASLLRIVLEQQVSLASARAASDRLCAVVDPLTPRGSAGGGTVPGLAARDLHDAPKPD
jgi:DNA-3-methyladenine glycosylase II